jgi:hypothetical protein
MAETTENGSTGQAGARKDRPARNVEDALAVIRAGGIAYIPTYYRCTVIDLKTLTKFERAGYVLLRDDADGKGIRMMRGRKTVYLFAGQLMLREE